MRALGCEADRDQVVAAIARSFARVFDREMFDREVEKYREVEKT
jgi:hypothetical protein